MHPHPFGLAQSHSPVDLPEPLDARQDGLAWTSRAILFAAATLALLNAEAVRGWAWQLPAGDWSARAIAAAEGWHSALDSLRLNRPAAAMRAGWAAVRAPSEPAQPAADSASSRSQREYSSSATG